MDILKIKTDSLAHYSYMVISNGEAAVIDPRRDSAVYVNKARQKDAAIKYIFETHRHEDFVSGAKQTPSFSMERAWPFNMGSLSLKETLLKSGTPHYKFLKHQDIPRSPFPLLSILRKTREPQWRSSPVTLCSSMMLDGLIFSKTVKKSLQVSCMIHFTKKFSRVETSV